MKTFEEQVFEIVNQYKWSRTDTIKNLVHYCMSINDLEGLKKKFPIKTQRDKNISYDVGDYIHPKNGKEFMKKLVRDGTPWKQLVFEQITEEYDFNSCLECGAPVLPTSTKCKRCGGVNE